MAVAVPHLPPYLSKCFSSLKYHFLHVAIPLSYLCYLLHAPSVPHTLGNYGSTAFYWQPSLWGLFSLLLEGRAFVLRVPES
jgi:hypothetical protein